MVLNPASDVSAHATMEAHTQESSQYFSLPYW